MLIAGSGSELKKIHWQQPLGLKSKVVDDAFELIFTTNLKSRVFLFVAV